MKAAKSVEAGVLDWPEQNAPADGAALERPTRFRPHVVATQKDAAFTPDDFPVASPARAFVKRCVDIALSLLALPIALVLGVPIALLIALGGGRPIYNHLRVGRDGRHFVCHKFRTMIAGADIALEMLLADDPELRAEWLGHFKLKNDPRVTPLGRLLRKTSLDEIPQILNVLKGEMSWVGPRPVIPQELSKYGAQASAYLACRPGITGLWQVNGRSHTTYAERTALDMQYAKTWSIWLDVKILLLTIPRVLAARGSY